MARKQTLFERVESARRAVQDLYIEAIRDEPLMETHKHLLAALRSLAAASDEQLPPPPKRRAAKTTDAPDQPALPIDRPPTPERSSTRPVNASGL